MISITNDAINLNEIINKLNDKGSGACVLFTGTVRDHNERGTVTKLYYEAYEKMAEKMLREREDNAVAKWKIKKFIAIHSTGTLNVGEISVAVAVLSEHRKEAFEACKFGIDSIKQKVPIWKQEFGESENHWVQGTIPT